MLSQGIRYHSNTSFAGEIPAKMMFCPKVRKDYYPFGMLMPGRHYTTGSASLAYRYGFNGAEKDNEIYGTGNSYSTEWRQYDARIGRWWSLDPAMAKYAAWSPYSFSFNNPIWWNDPDGDDPDPEGDPKKTTETASKTVNEIKSTDPPGNQPARCNEGVNCAFKGLTGSNELSGKKANQMIDYMSSSPNFTPIDVSEAQGAANSGDIVIAGWSNPNGAGHVAMVVPGTAETNGTWNNQPAKTIGGIPRVMDTGSGMRTPSQSVNYSFGNNKTTGVNKQASTIFFKYTPQLSKTTSNMVSTRTQTYGPFTLNVIKVSGEGNKMNAPMRSINQIPNP